MRLTAGVDTLEHKERSVREELHMDDRRAPNLEAMDQREASRLLNELASDLSPEGEYQIRHPEDYVMEMPQSGERFRGRENMRAFQEAFPDNSDAPTIRIRRVLAREGLWSSRVSSTTGADKSCMALPYSSSRTARYGVTLATSPSPSKHQGGGRTW
jgi:hypothetical protein